MNAMKYETLGKPMFPGVSPESKQGTVGGVRGHDPHAPRMVRAAFFFVVGGNLPSSSTASESGWIFR